MTEQGGKSVDKIEFFSSLVFQLTPRPILKRVSSYSFAFVLFLGELDSGQSSEVSDFQTLSVHNKFPRRAVSFFSNSTLLVRHGKQNRLPKCQTKFNQFELLFRQFFFAAFRISNSKFARKMVKLRNFRLHDKVPKPCNYPTFELVVLSTCDLTCKNCQKHGSSIAFDHLFERSNFLPTWSRPG